jgi:hypothetical protein
MARRKPVADFEAPHYRKSRVGTLMPPSRRGSGMPTAPGPPPPGVRVSTICFSFVPSFDRHAREDLHRAVRGPEHQVVVAILGRGDLHRDLGISGGV